MTLSLPSPLLKAAKYEIQKTLNLAHNIVSLQVWVDVSRFSPCMKSRPRVYSERQSLWATKFGFVARFSLSSPLIAQQMCSCTGKSTNQRPAFLQPATNVFVAGQVDHARWKTQNIDQNLQRNNVARQVEGFCISSFPAFKFPIPPRALPSLTKVHHSVAKSTHGDISRDVPHWY